VNIWAAPDAETQAKIKYAKWNALRIVKALKEGRDPNESNPKSAPEPEEQLPDLDPKDPEVQALEGGPKSLQPSVVEVPDEQDLVDRRMARQSSIDQSLHPSSQVSARGSPVSFEPYARNGDDNVSPLEPSPPNDRNGSIGGGYFPEVPSFTAEEQPGSHPTAPPEDIVDLRLPLQPSFAPGSQSPGLNQFAPPSPRFVPPNPPPQDYYHQAVPPPAPHHPTASPQQPYFAPPLQQPYQQPYQPPQPPHSHFAPSPAPQPAASQPTQYRNSQLNIDDVSIAKTQKHARFVPLSNRNAFLTVLTWNRWAISALNFEDGETAVKELREALKTLGAL